MNEIEFFSQYNINSFDELEEIPIKYRDGSVHYYHPPSDKVVSLTFMRDKEWYISDFAASLHFQYTQPQAYAEKKQAELIEYLESAKKQIIFTSKFTSPKDIVSNYNNNYNKLHLVVDLINNALQNNAFYYYFYKPETEPNFITNVSNIQLFPAMRYHYDMEHPDDTDAIVNARFYKQMQDKNYKKLDILKGDILKTNDRKILSSRIFDVIYDFNCNVDLYILINNGVLYKICKNQLIALCNLSFTNLEYYIIRDSKSDIDAVKLYNNSSFKSSPSRTDILNKYFKLLNTDADTVVYFKAITFAEEMKNLVRDSILYDDNNFLYSDGMLALHYTN